jgi:hypothetical protein
VRAEISLEGGGAGVHVASKSLKAFAELSQSLPLNGADGCRALLFKKKGRESFRTAPQATLHWTLKAIKVLDFID